MDHYWNIKKENAQYILFFRVGDFFELFEEDAIQCAPLLGIVLTQRGGIPMCGIPVYNLNTHLRKLMEHNLKVAICDQIESAAEARSGKRLIKREITHIITPGTFSDFSRISNNFIMAIHENTAIYLDVNTHECYSQNAKQEEDNSTFICSLIKKIKPTEVLGTAKSFSFINLVKHNLINYNIEFTQIDGSSALEILQIYLKELKMNIEIKPIEKNNYLLSNNSLIEYLEFFTDNSGETKNSLYNFLNKTETAMGARLLRNKLIYPLADKELINIHLDSIDFFSKKKYKLLKLDLHRYLNQSTTAAHLYKLAEAISYYFKIFIDLPVFLKFNQVTIHHEILSIINEFGIINELDKEIANLLLKIENCCLPHKVQSNSLIGFFVEVKKGFTMPDNFILKGESMKVCRYITLDLIQLENQYKNLCDEKEKKNKETIEYLKKKIETERSEIERLIEVVAYVDYFQSCAIIANNNNYYRPVFTNKNEISIKEARHPVIECLRPFFIHNDFTNRHILLTGCNMGGKSTYLRSIVLCLWLAHMGMFVPAHLETGVLHSLCVRVGSKDDILNNESTFMTELLEYAEIMQLINNNSLVVLDEIGRGTDIISGLSISAAIMEELVNKNTAFIISTHFYELSHCATYLPIVNKMMEFSYDHTLLPLYKVVNGVADSSFGIQLIKQTNMLKSVINKSEEIYNKISSIDREKIIW